MPPANRSPASALARLSAADRERLRATSQPPWIEPMKATLVARPPADRGWLYERKLDGVRAIVFRSGSEVRLCSRNRLSQNNAFPELVEAIAAEPAQDFIADGEIVAFEGSRTSFERLQRRIHIHDPARARLTGVAVYLYLFDLVHLDGHDLRALQLEVRKSLLRQALSFAGPVRYTPQRLGDGEVLFRAACAKRWEGLIAKRADSTYAGRRSKAWLKLKCANEQELVIGGFTAPQGSRSRFGALLVGYFDGGELRYAGKVGTGFSEAMLDALGAELEKLERPTPPFAPSGDLPRAARWVEPELVAEVGFSEWTRDGKLRHPRFLGLRTDKSAREVVRETPAARAPATPTPRPPGSR